MLCLRSYGFLRYINNDEQMKFFVEWKEREDKDEAVIMQKKDRKCQCTTERHVSDTKLNEDMDIATGEPLNKMSMHYGTTRKRHQSLMKTWILQQGNPLKKM